MWISKEKYNLLVKKMDKMQSGIDLLSKNDYMRSYPPMFNKGDKLKYKDRSKGTDLFIVNETELETKYFSPYFKDLKYYEWKYIITNIKTGDTKTYTGNYLLQNEVGDIFIKTR